MPRTDEHLDGMLRHLGAAYYESLHGRATEADVTRALDSVAQHLNEAAQPGPARTPTAPQQRGSAAPQQRVSPEGGGIDGFHGWSRRVGDVMATSVITVDRATPYKEIARLLAVNRISGMPVLKMGREVAGVVTEADLLSAEAENSRRMRHVSRLSWRSRDKDRQPLIAGQLMTSPAITVGPHVTVHAASRLMSTHHVRLLPVVDEHGTLVGVVSRRDLLAVFLRPDEDIARDVERVIDEILLAEPGEAEVAVHEGVVTLTGSLDPKKGAHGDLIPVALRLMWDVDGVVDIIDHLGQPRPTPRAAGPAGLDGAGGE